MEGQTDGQSQRVLMHSSLPSNERRKMQLLHSVGMFQRISLRDSDFICSCQKYQKR